MVVTFRIGYHTQPGQSLWLAGSAPLPLPPEPVPMQFVDAEHWQVTLSLPTNGGGRLNYCYILRQPDGTQIADWGRDRQLVLREFPGKELLVLDSWNQPGYIENVFYTAPFKKVFLAENFKETRPLALARATHTFRVKAPLLKKNQTLCLLGECATLGYWNTHSAVLLGREPDSDYFSVALDLQGQKFPLAYKYGVFDVEKQVFLRYEDGANRVLWDEIKRDCHTVVADGFARLPLEPWRGAGVAVPVFSLRSENSFGTGEFADLKLLADWGRKTGLKLIQLLPVNDTSASGTWHDSYPYAAISAFALHPLYINLAAVAGKQFQERLQQLEPERQRLNALDALDYEPVMKAKLGFLRAIFPAQKAATFATPEYQDFFARNQYWLVPYAAFCCLRDQFGTVDFNRWPKHQKYVAADIAALAKDNDEIAFHYFLQFHLHRQLQEAAAHVHAAGMVLKGDLAIGVYRHSADVWQSPELYHLDQQAGAPPDPFSATGQNWGFPTYNWPRMASDGYAWWKQRFAQMANYFDAFRIDHILGFFRIWSSPAHAVEGILGHFVPALPVLPTEFALRGIPFDRERLTKPFVTDGVLLEIFGYDAVEVRQKFVEDNGSARLALKPEFATQQQVAAYFAGQPQNERNARLKAGLFQLISNVILLEAEGALHFRICMEQTPSFQHLPPAQQARLRDLYVDYFFRRQDEFWRREAMQKLPALKRVTNMLICGEDLGMVPACVPEVMRELGFLGLEIQRMPKRLGVEFSRPAEAPYLSVISPATHDMSTIRGWWEEDRELIRRFYHHELGLEGEPPDTAEPWVVKQIVQQHLVSPAMWSVFQVQDLLGIDEQLRRADVASERINVPAVPHFYWRYRLHLTLEQLLAADAFNGRLKQMLAEAGRC